MTIERVAIPSILFLLGQQHVSGFVSHHDKKYHMQSLNLPTEYSNLKQYSAYESTGGAKITELSMFGKLFGGNDEKAGKTDDGSLAKYTNLGSDDVKFDSMSDYISKWSKLFETDPKGMGLTTPVAVVPSKQLQSDQDEEANILDVADFVGVQLIFKNTSTGYKSSKDEAKEDKDGGGNSKKKKEKLQGGVEVLVEKLASSGEVRVRARRCNMDDDTMIKEMSEEAILSELQKAIGVWKRENL